MGEGSKEFFTLGVKNPQYTIIKEFFTLYNNNKLNNTQSASLTHPDLSRLQAKRLAHNLVSVNGWTIAKRFYELTASTKPEIRALTPIDHQSVNRIVNTFTEVGLLKVLGRVGLPWSTRGRPVLVYGFPHATPEDTAQAQKRYGAVLIAKKDVVRFRARDLIEGVGEVRSFMVDHGLLDIPDPVIVRGLLKGKGLKITTDQVLTALDKELRGVDKL